MMFFLSHLSHAQSVNAQFDVGKFQSENKTYIETYLSIDGNSVNYVLNGNRKFQSSLVVTIEIISNDNKTVFDKYNLNSPEIDDTSNIDFVFIDQQRYFLNDGNYQLKLNIKDNNDSDNEISHQQDLTVKTTNGFSNIQLIDSYSDTKEVNILSKSGYDLVPFISNFYNSNNKKITFYYEYYNDSKEAVLLQTKVISQSTNKIVNNLALNKKSNKKTTPILASFSLNDIPTGTYYLEVTAIDKNNNTLHSKNQVFYKVNKDIIDTVTAVEGTFVSRITNKDSLKLFINYLYPIQTTKESIFADNQLNYDDLKMLQNYFYNFWKERNPFDSESSWLTYRNKVKAVNNKFGNGLQKGYLSDRGRIYLSYGQPNSISEEVLPNQFQPFEVWHYYNIGNERNIKFIFSNKNMPNEYRLVYSNKSGEVSDTDWLNRFEENYYDSGDDGEKSPFDYFKTPN
ncbi:MAG: GWxTD domain-containing protein [Flavobacteriales bacterium]|nr:GWxTD domain-containing protein [Flavobacteriales bacterium]MBL6872817.1 GWxTD domain-containing protein [Flavobacteriales bacterium]